MRPNTLLKSLRSSVNLAAQRFSSNAKETPFHNLANPSSQESQQIFRPLAAQVINATRKALTTTGFGHSSIEYGHRIVAMRTTLLLRLSQAIDGLFHNKIENFKNHFGAEELQKRIAENQPRISFTTHPTEGQNLGAIIQKDLIIQVQTVLGHAQKNGFVSAKDMVKLARISKHAGIETAKPHEIPDLQKFAGQCAAVLEKIATDFATKPIHHVTKLTIQGERDLMLYHMDNCKKYIAEIVTKNPEVKSDDIKIKSWAYDQDGKPHIKFGTGAIFEYQSQQKFFGSLVEMLEDFADTLDLKKQSSSEFRATVLDKVTEIKNANAAKILVGDLPQDTEKQIADILSSCGQKDEEFQKIQNYVKSSGCKTSENGFTTREEVDKTNAALADIQKICDGNLDPKIVAENFSKFSDNTKRQVMCLMESAILHPKHEHIISQFDCELSSFKNTIKLFELAKQLPEHHESIPDFKKLCDVRKEEAGCDLYQELFSATAIAAAKKSFAQVSPLAETSQTIPKVVSCTKAILADAESVDYITKSGGTLRQTQSNSDGSAEVGQQKVVISYLETDIEVKKLAEKAGFKLEILQGIGGNDIDRMAPWLLQLLKSAFTAQGSDGQHQTMDRLISLFLKERDTSPDKLLELKEKYPAVEISDLTEFYHQAHLKSERGVQVELNGKPVFTGNLTHRRPYTHEVAEELGKSSSRPTNRSGNAEEVTLQKNTPETWGNVVYNNDLRRIGGVNLQRVNGFPTFLLAPFFAAPKNSSPELVADYAAIPLIRNAHMSALCALGLADRTTFALINGYTPDMLNTPRTHPVAEMARNHMNFQIEGCSKALRNIVAPLIHNSSQEIKDKAEKLYEQAESGDPLKKLSGIVIEMCNTLAQDPKLDLETKCTVACIAQQVANATAPGNYYDTRANLAQKAYDASQRGDVKTYQETCKSSALTTRSAGNPASPAGSKTHGLFSYACNSIKNPVPAIKTVKVLFADFFGSENSKESELRSAAPTQNFSTGR